MPGGTARRGARASPAACAGAPPAERGFPRPHVPPTILVVDDDDAVRRIVVAALEEDGYRVAAVSNGEVALALLDQSESVSPDSPSSGASAAEHVGLIILDLHMPVMDGWQFVGRYRQLRRAHAPIVLFAAVSGPEAAAHAEALGVAGFVTKPFDLDTLLETVARAMAASPHCPSEKLGTSPVELTAVPCDSQFGSPRVGARRGPAPPGPVRDPRQRQLERLRAEVARVQETSAQLRDTIRHLVAAEAARQLTADELRQVTSLRRQSEAMRQEMALFRREFERLRGTEK